MPPIEPTSPDILDVRQTKCPLNFVKTRLALEKIPLQGVLEVWVGADSESALNIPNSIRAEGHEVLSQEPLPNDAGIRLQIRRLK